MAPEAPASGPFLPGALRRIYDPASFQGSRLLLGRKRGRGYFEGWYFKAASPSGAVIAFIPGVSLSADPHAFIQVNDGPAGHGSYYRFPIEEFRASEPGGDFWIQIGGNRFSREGARIEVSEGGSGYSAELGFDSMVSFPPRLLSPGIMGWYSFLPFMECYHGLVSVSHGISGKVVTPSASIDFSGGRGYIEKDWGRSFPESWIWMQTNLFGAEDASFMLSIAKIPWLGRSFTGFLSFLRFGGRTRVLATYNGARITGARAGASSLEILVERKGQRLRLKAEYGTGGTLSAPVRGKMERQIKESVDSRVSVEFSDEAGGESFSGTGIAAGLEMVGSMEGLLGGQLRNGLGFPTAP
jgi:hypothetical protein